MSKIEIYLLLREKIGQGRLEEGRLEEGRLEEGRLEEGRLEEGHRCKINGVLLKLFYLFLSLI